MTDAPWRTDPMYGGMSENSARKSYEASLLRHQPEPEWIPENPFDKDEFDRRRAQIDVMLAEYEQATDDAVAWWQDWKRRNCKPQEMAGFKALTRGEAGHG